MGKSPGMENSGGKKSGRGKLRRGKARREKFRLRARVYRPNTLDDKHGKTAKELQDFVTGR